MKNFGFLFILFSLIANFGCARNQNTIPFATDTAQLMGSPLATIQGVVGGNPGLQYVVYPANGGFQISVMQPRPQMIYVTNHNAFSMATFLTGVFSGQVSITSQPQDQNAADFSATFSSERGTVAIQAPSVNGDTSQFNALNQFIRSQI